MNTVTFRTEEAIFQFNQEAVMELLEHRKTSYEIKEPDTLIQVLSSQSEKTILSSAEHPDLGYVALDLINSNEGAVVCNNCGKQYRFNQLEAFTVGPDDATFRAASTKKGGFKGLFRKKLKLPGMQGGQGYNCPRGHTLIFMITWRT